MPSINYQKICDELIADLPQKQREVIVRRFGLSSGQRETLESIGKSFGICRERVRQIEKVSLNKMKKKAGLYKEAFKSFAKYLKSYGGIRKEESLLRDLGGEDSKVQAQVYFLLMLSGEFKRISEGDDFHALWVTGDGFFDAAKGVTGQIMAKLAEVKRPMNVKEIMELTNLKKPVLEAYLEISKTVQKNQENLYGLRDWPEINPKGIKDKIYLLFKKTQKPFHFSQVAGRIPGSLVQTVHNELIRDPRFVLIGRGIYALKEWGYREGDVKDVILNIFETENRPLTKEEIVQRVLKQRLIKENTVLMNLSNKKYFVKDAEGKYQRNIQEA